MLPGFQEPSSPDGAAGDRGVVEGGYTLARDAFGRLVLTFADGEPHVGVAPVRAFPIAAPDEGVSLVGPDGHELAWIERLSAAPREVREMVEDELAARDFMPEVRRIIGVSRFSTPSTWEVQTDRGETSFLLRGEEHIRRLGAHGLLIADQHGVQFLVRDLRTLDKASRALLDRFL